MCLAIPGKIVEKKDFAGQVEVMGVVRKCSFELVPEAKIGDYVLVHAGFAIEVIDEQQAKETIELFKELEQHGHE